jgi:hypothetical protein
VFHGFLSFVNNIDSPRPIDSYVWAEVRHDGVKVWNQSAWPYYARRPKDRVFLDLMETTYRPSGRWSVKTTFPDSLDADGRACAAIECVKQR